MVTIFLIENYPVLLTRLDYNIEALGRAVGEWAWVGRVL